MWHKVLNPKSLYLCLRSVEVGEILTDDLVDITYRLLVLSCVAHHQICDQDVERGIRVLIVYFFLEFRALALALFRKVIHVCGDHCV